MGMTYSKSTTKLAFTAGCQPPQSSVPSLVAAISCFSTTGSTNKEVKQDKKQVVLDWLWSFANAQNICDFHRDVSCVGCTLRVETHSRRTEVKKYTRTTVQRHLSQLKPYLNTKTILSCGRKLIVGHLHWGDGDHGATKLLVSVVQSFACTSSGSMQHSYFYSILLWNTEPLDDLATICNTMGVSANLEHWLSTNRIWSFKFWLVPSTRI